MVLSIELDSATASRLKEQALAAGKEAPVYVAELVTRAAAKPDFDSMFASIRSRFEKSGISDEELIADLTEAQSEYRAEMLKKAQ